jgi:hypothetical protein
MDIGGSSKLAPQLAGERSSVAIEGGSSPEREDAWDVVGADDLGDAADPFPPSAPELDREGLLFEAGRLYGRDTARERAALLDGSHPLHRLKRPAA